MIIYIDVLIFINTIITYFLLLSVCKIYKIRPTFKRLLFASIFGGISSIIIFWQTSNFILVLLAKVLICVATIFLCFGFQNKSYFLKYLLSFVAITFLYAGASLLIEQFSSYSKVFVANTVTYYDISALELVVLTAVVYLFLRLILLFKNNTKNGDELFSCQITLGEKSVSLVCANDTGNSLVDPYTSSPVLIAKKSSLAPLGEIKTRYPIVFSTVNSSGLIEIFYPDKILVGDRAVNIAVGIANSEFSKDFDGLVSPKIIELLEER